MEEARKALRDGKIIIYPTDTVWGMGCDPFNQKAIDNLFTIKGKEMEGLSVMFNHKIKIYDYCKTNTKAKKIIDEFLPGPITLIPVSYTLLTLPTILLV